jgi:CheY-like chemotaxis protein
MEPTITVLVVEDEPAIADAVAARLQSEGDLLAHRPAHEPVTCGVVTSD